MKIYESTHQYGPHPRQNVTAYIPEPAPCGDNPLLPGMVMIHGGYWAQESGLGDWPSQFAEQGWAVFTPRYRLNTDSPWPAQRQDILSSVEWIKEWAYAFRLDTDRLAAFGSSAGGHLAVQAGIFLDEIRAVVALSAPLSPRRAWLDGADPTGSWAEKRARLRVEAETLAGCPPEGGGGCPDVWADLSCPEHVTGDEPPMLLAYCSDDLVPDSHGVEMRASVKNAGGDGDVVTVLTAQGQGHGMTLMSVPGVSHAVTGFLSDSTRLPPGS
jgi:acetyl esterase/lipase